MLAFIYRLTTASLIWEYLDGSIAPRRFDRLQHLLTKSATARRRFIDCATLNALLFSLYNPGRFAASPGGNGLPQRTDDPLAKAIEKELSTMSHQDQDEPAQPHRRTKRPAG